MVLGLAGPLARPARAATTGSAVAFGALAVTLAVGLGGTLVAVQTGGDPDRSGVVTVRTVLPPEGGPEASFAVRPADPAAVARVLADHTGTRSSRRTSRTEVDVAGLTGGAPLVAYEGEGAATVMISGRWFAARGEAVVAGRFLQATGLRVEDDLVVSERGRSARLTIVGEVFDLGDDGMTLRTSLESVAVLESPYLPAVFGVELTSGTDRDRYLAELNQVLEPLGAQASATESPSSSVLTAMRGLIAMLTLMLVAVAGLGVLNTVVLDTRDRVHDQGVLKALGMTPRQTVVQVLTGVAAIGLVAGAVGAPLGAALHRAVMPAMGRAAGFTIPQAFIDVHGGLLPLLMAFAGVPLAVAAPRPPRSGRRAPVRRGPCARVSPLAAAAHGRSSTTSRTTSAPATAIVARNGSLPAGRRAARSSAVVVAASSVQPYVVTRPGGPTTKVAVEPRTSSPARAAETRRPSRCGSPATPVARSSSMSGSTLAKCAPTPRRAAAAVSHGGGQGAPGRPSVTKAGSRPKARAYGSQEAAVLFSLRL